MTHDLLSLYRYAEQCGIDVDWFDLMQVPSLSIALPGDGYSIAINPWKLGTIAQETVALAHELGHCETGSFYNCYAALDIRQKHENRADKWAIRQLITADALAQAQSDGYTELWQLADYFSVTPEFMQKAICLHTHGNLAVNIYS